jgi:hypothetical protein
MKMSKFKDDIATVIYVCASVITLVLAIGINERVSDMVREVDALIVKVDDIRAYTDGA